MLTPRWPQQAGTFSRLPDDPAVLSAGRMGLDESKMGAGAGVPARTDGIVDGTVRVQREGRSGAGVWSRANADGPKKVARRERKART